MQTEQGALELDPGLETPGADIDPTGTYRYRLWRTVAPDADDRRVVFVMLNPSTADAETDDPTLRRCMGFARAWGFRYLEVVNMFALRSSRPEALLDHPDPMGPCNLDAWALALGRADMAVMAWGATVDELTRQRPEVMARVVRRHPMDMARLLEVPTRCLGRTASGAPRHPLYVPRDARPVPYP